MGSRDELMLSLPEITVLSQLVRCWLGRLGRTKFPYHKHECIINKLTLRYLPTQTEISV